MVEERTTVHDERKWTRLGEVELPRAYCMSSINTLDRMMAQGWLGDLSRWGSVRRGNRDRRQRRVG